MKLIKFIVFSVLLTLSGHSQLKLPSGYKSVEMGENGIEKEYHKEFDNIDQAINAHKVSLFMNGIDTSKTVVNKRKFPNTPIFSFFYKKDNQENVFVTFVTKGVVGYESVFLVCYIEYIDFFVSDGYMLYFDPRINKRKNHEY